MNTTLTAADLPTLRRLAAHYRARAPHRGLIGGTVCHALASIADRLIRVIERHGEARPDADYGRMDRKAGAKR